MELSWDKAVTRNGLPPKFLIPGSNMVTDQEGIAKVKAVYEEFVGNKPDTKDSRIELRNAISALYLALKQQGRLWHKDQI
jgi:hypothetical protein